MRRRAVEAMQETVGAWSDLFLRYDADWMIDAGAHSGVTFVLFLSCSRLIAFIEAAAPRSIVFRYACAPTATRSYLATVCVLFFLFLFLSFFRSVGDVAFSEYFCTIAVFSSYGEYVVPFFSLPAGVFLPCDHGTGWTFDISLCENSVNQTNTKGKNRQGSSR